MLYPVDNEIRQVKSLDGIWRFKKRKIAWKKVLRKKWYEKANFRILSICQFQQATMTSQLIKSCVIMFGWVWYETDAVIPRAWTKDQRIVISFWQCYSACKLSYFKW